MHPLYFKNPDFDRGFFIPKNPKSSKI